MGLIEEGGDRYLVAPYGEVEWVRNARAAGWVTLERRGRREAVGLDQVDAHTAGWVLRRYVALEPITLPFFDAASDAPVEAFAAEAPRHPVFRLRPAAR